MSKRIVIDISAKHVNVGGNILPVLSNINCAFRAGDFISIIGASGCGKSTLLRAVMGLDMDFEGSILIGDEPVQGIGLDRGIVFQEPRLLPWARVRQNIEFAVAPGGRGAGAEEVNRLMALFGLAGFESAWPNQLSGGMMQRVALARALVNLPEVLLMDEPFGALDAHTKTVMQDEIVSVFRARRTTTLMVTHDVEEAVFLSDAILIMTPRPGSLLDVVEIDLPKPRDRADPKFVSLRFDVLRRAFGNHLPAKEGGPTRASGSDAENSNSLL